MRVTINLPDDIHQQIAVAALKKRRNSKELVITEILRAYYGGGLPSEKQHELLHWRLPPTTVKQIQALRREAKSRWA